MSLTSFASNAFARNEALFIDPYICSLSQFKKRIELQNDNKNQTKKIKNKKIKNKNHSDQS